jgi:quercetin dioxygenase-like cupin family protein
LAIGNRGFVELLRFEPRSFSPLHRHTGEVHAFNLEGSRKLCTGELIGPGDYVYERQATPTNGKSSATFL